MHLSSNPFFLYKPGLVLRADDKLSELVKTPSNFIFLIKLVFFIRCDKTVLFMDMHLSVPPDESPTGLLQKNLIEKLPVW